MGEGLSPISPEEMTIYNEEATDEAERRKKFDQTKSEDDNDSDMGSVEKQVNENELPDDAQ